MRRRPNMSERLAAVLLTIKRGEQWLIPEPLRSTGDAKAICAAVEWNHDVQFAVRPHNDPRFLTPLSPAEHRARYAKDAGEIARVRRGLKRRAGKTRKGQPMPGSRDSKWKRRMDGTVERRTS